MDTQERHRVTEGKTESGISVVGEKKRGGGGARPTQLERESCTWRRGGGGMAWSERQVSRPDLSCRKLFMRLNKMMLQLPMMNNLCLCACNRNGV